MPWVYLHRMVWLGSDLDGHLLPTRCHRQGGLPLDQVALSNPALNTSRDGTPTALLHGLFLEDFTMCTGTAGEEPRGVFVVVLFFFFFFCILPFSYTGQDSRQINTSIVDASP